MNVEELFDYYAYEDINAECGGESTSKAKREVMGASGIGRFLGDLGASAESVTALILGWQFGMCGLSISRYQFIQSMHRLYCKNVSDLAAKLRHLEKEVSSSGAQFEILFAFAFEFAKESREHRVITSDIAASMLELVLQCSPFPHHARGKGKHPVQFIRFLREHQTRPINRDQWMCFLDFSHSVSDDLSSYDSAAAWPMIFDEYVAWLKGAPKP